MKKKIIVAIVVLVVVLASCLATYAIMIGTASFNMTDTHIDVRIGGQFERIAKAECAHTVQCCVCDKFFTLPQEPADENNCYCADCSQEN